MKYKFEVSFLKNWFPFLQLFDSSLKNIDVFQFHNAQNKCTTASVKSLQITCIISCSFISVIDIHLTLHVHYKTMTNTYNYFLFSLKWFSISFLLFLRHFCLFSKSKTSKCYEEMSFSTATFCYTTWMHLCHILLVYWCTHTWSVFTKSFV